jgi:hypothetical protein
MVPGPKYPSADELGAGIPIAIPAGPAPPSELELRRWPPPPEEVARMLSVIWA